LDDAMQQTQEGIITIHKLMPLEGKYMRFSEMQQWYPKLFKN